MHSTKSTIMFVLAMTTLVSLLLAALFNGLKDIHAVNEAIYNKRAVLSAIENQLPSSLDDMSDEMVGDMFDKNIKQIVLDLSGNLLDSDRVIQSGYNGGLAEHIDMKKEKKKDDADKIIPLFEYSNEKGEKFFICTVRGNGLWDEIWGYIAIEQDLNTIAGVAFDHVTETPGLGAEIKDNGAFKTQFKGKKLYNNEGEYKSIYVRKGGAKDPVHEVDGISGATITADGVTEMMTRGLKYYEPYFKSLKS